MSELLARALGARRYETADPATSDEVARNADIAALDRLLVQTAADMRSGSVLPLRSGTRG
ncbi:MAG: hypothetical protein JSS55_12110 [Proteobacteria bacterium]|nr:hypothetical protein [Pseudomonadota bacterium]